MISGMPALQALVRARRTLTTLTPEERAVWENLHAEERVSPARASKYTTAINGSVLPALNDLDAFTTRHKNAYLEKAVHLDKAEPQLPDTFDAALNGANHWPGIDDDVALYRLEDPSFAVGGSGVDVMELQQAIDLAHDVSADGSSRGHARAVLNRVTDNWNDRRDRRPSFATTHDEIAALLAAPGTGWAEALRDELGLGHYDPKLGAPITVILMRYTVREVRQCKAAGVQAFCIPTMLDGTVNPCFVPTPVPGLAAKGSEWQMGRAINLAATSESDYGTRMRAELVHSYVDYRPEHLVRWGFISRPVRRNLAQLRTFHLSWLRLLTDRDTGAPFDTDLAHV